MTEIIDLARIVDGTIRTRMQPVEAEADEQLAASIQAVGVLEPVLLRPARSLTTWPGATMPVNGPGNQMLEIVKGARRIQAARLAGMGRIPAVIRDMTDDEVLTEQAADALQVAMHPVDQWMAMQAMIQFGMVPAKAGQVLGLKLPEIRKLDRLGQLHPNMLALCRREMPEEAALRVVLMAPLELQETAAERAIASLAEGDEFYWWQIADQCRLRRAYKAWAIFDTKAVDIVFEEDMFAEPGSKEQFQTSEVAAFREAQRAALEQKVAADKHAMFVEADPRTGNTTDPPGWRRDYAAKERKRGQRTLYVLAASGQVQEWIMSREKAPTAAEDDDAADGADDGPEDDDTDLDTPPPPAPAPKELITKAGVALIEARKTAALRAALAEDRDAHDLLTLMILLFDASNVHVSGIPWEQQQALGKLPVRLIDPAGNLRDDVEEATIRATARMLIANVADFTHGGSMNPSVGAAGEWIGRLVGADAHLGRFDDEAFLATCKGDLLKQAAEAGQIKWTGTATAMRARLKDQVEGWTPDAAQFGAPGPRP